MRQLGVSLVNIALGNPYAQPHFGRPFEYPPPDGYESPEPPLLGVDRHFKIAGAIQAANPGHTYRAPGSAPAASKGRADREDDPTPPSSGAKPRVADRDDRRERDREHSLALGDPRDRLRVRRMHRPEQHGDRSDAAIEPEVAQRDEPAADRDEIEHEVREVKARVGIAPDRAVEHHRQVAHRQVLGAEHEPRVARYVEEDRV